MGGGAIAVPRLLDHDRGLDILILEDLGPLPDVRRWVELDTDSGGAIGIGKRIGGFVGRLHSKSTGVADITSQVKNTQIQQTRLVTQYQAVEGLARDYGLPDAIGLGRRAWEN